MTLPGSRQRAESKGVQRQRETKPGTLVSRARDGDSTARKTEGEVTRKQTSLRIIPTSGRPRVRSGCCSQLRCEGGF